MKTSVTSIAAAALLAVALVAPQSAAAADASAEVKVKAGVSAKAVGRCTTATILVAKMTEEEAAKTNDTTFKDLGMMWLTYIQAQPEAYQKEAMASMSDTATAYQTTMKDESNNVMATIVSDVTACLEYIE